MLIHLIFVIAFSNFAKFSDAVPQIKVDTTKARDLADFGAKVKSTLEEWYPKIEKLLHDNDYDYKEPTVISVVFDPNYDGVAGTSGNNIVGSAKYYRQHLDDIGSMVHELTHVIQQYRQGCEGWVTEGIADYIRYFHYEPQKHPERPEKGTRYQDGYGDAAWLFRYVEVYGWSSPPIYWWVNRDCRNNNWNSDGFWKRMTGKTVDEWWTEVTANPPQITVDTSAASELSGFGSKVKSAMEKWWPQINSMLDSPTYVATGTITVTFKDCDGVAGTGGNNIEGCISYYKGHQDDVGSMIHEMVHVIQAYGNTNCPGWFTEGLADWVRFYIYEPQNAPSKPSASAHYSDGYQTTAYFLNYVEAKVEGTLKEINALCRENNYSEEIWEQLTDETPQQLWDDMQQND